ncbi:MAG: DUF1987 domain-containing protein [Bacteroidales bacterium]|nr:DUF1987 domain-containing protein [Bacteroidales bacterium]MDD4671891.1 DUF1987 domain-containing protein [Bacteroidales bacterium]MDY0349427.1 DUF1987 domain-containing protein [Tenuifilaceae bacterium]
MKKLHIEPCKDSPEVILDPNSNVFSIKGICHPENVTRFFEPVLAWFDDFKEELIAKEERRDVKIVFLFRYFNSATYKYLISILHKIYELKGVGCSVFVEWQYEEDDEEMKESGEELFEFSGLQIPYVCVESEL